MENVLFFDQGAFSQSQCIIRYETKNFALGRFETKLLEKTSPISEKIQSANHRPPEGASNFIVKCFPLAVSLSANQAKKRTIPIRLLPYDACPQIADQSSIPNFRERKKRFFLSLPTADYRPPITDPIHNLSATNSR